MSKKLCQSKFLALSLIFSFVFLITLEAAPKNINNNTKKEFRPIVKVRQTQQEIPEVQKKMFNRLIEEGKKLLQEEMDYEGAISKFKEAHDLAITREQKADAIFYLSLGHYATIEEKGEEEFIETIKMLIEIDYYRELDSLLCPPRYGELFRGIKKEYGALRIQSRPPGADVYLNDSKVPIGQTPITVGAKAGTVKVKVKKGKQEKSDTLRVVAGETTTSSTFILKGKSSLIYVIGGIVLAGGVGAALLGGGKGNGDGAPTPSPGPTTGSIQVNSNPTGAQVFLDGNDTGRTTNTTLTDVSAGSHSIKLVKEGYEDYEQSVSVSAGQTTTVNATLTEIIPEDYVFVTKWGSEGSGDGQFDDLEGLAIDSSGYVYVADTNNDRIQKFTSDGVFVTKWGSSGSGDGQMGNPYSVAVDDAGFVYVADDGNRRVQKFTSDGTFVTKWGSDGTGDGQFQSLRAIDTDGSGFLYVADMQGNRIQKFTSNGTFVTKWGSEGTGDGQFHFPQGIAADREGFVYVADNQNWRIQKFTSDGTFVTKWGSFGTEDDQFNSPTDIAVDIDSDVYVADGTNYRIMKFTSGGTFITKWGRQGSGDGQFEQAWTVAVDKNYYVYVTDFTLNCIQKFAPASAIQRIAKLTYSPLKNNHSLNRNLRPRPGLLIPPALKRWEIKQRFAHKKARKAVDKR